MVIDQEKLDNKLANLRMAYEEALPFPSTYIDDFLRIDAVKQLQNDFPDVSAKVWTHYIHYNERKYGLTKWKYFPTSVQGLITEMSQPPFIKWLENLTGISGIFADPDMEGSGLHLTLPGGFLNIHADFTVHPLHKNWRRRVNVLVYLNENWESEWGGDLELWDEKMHKCEKRIAPTLNRAAIFSTGKKTYHGYPNPITCPPGSARKSIAMYFYTKDDNFEKAATDYRSRPDDGYKKPLIWMDTKMISIYSKIKGILGFNDDFVSSILGKFNIRK
jgi:hypothetical protein